MPPSPRPFSQRWTPEDTRQQVEAPDFPRHGTPAEQHHWRQHVLAPLDENLGQAIGEHLAWLLNQGVDVLPPHSDRLETPFLRALRRLINAPNDPEAQVEAGRPFVNHLSLYFYAHKDRLKEPAFHEELVAHISEGNFSSLCGDLQTCAATGLRVNYNFHNWQGVAGQILFLDPDRPYRSTFEPLAPETLAPPQTYTATIPVPSGVLLIADWIRIPAFGELTKPVDDDEPGDALARMKKGPPWVALSCWNASSKAWRTSGTLFWHAVRAIDAQHPAHVFQAADGGLEQLHARRT